MEHDLHHKVLAVNAFDLRVIDGDGTEAGNIIDTLGFESIEFIGISGTITDGIHTFKLEDGDDSGLSDAADVSSELVLGELPVFIAADDDTVLRVGCITKKRFIRVSLVTTDETTGIDFFGIIAIQSNAKTNPTTEQAT